jgi:hypothetical protein
MFSTVEGGRAEYGIEVLDSSSGGSGLGKVLAFLNPNEFVRALRDKLMADDFELLVPNSPVRFFSEDKLP